MTEIQKSIIKTIAYFDIFSYPLTLLEFHKWLIYDKQISVFDLQQELETMNQIEQEKGFYFLAGKSDYIKIRLQRYSIAEKKFKARRLIIRLLCIMPYVKFLGICNSLSYSNALDQSDIDLFIITDKKHVYTTRFFTATLVHLLNLRPQKNKTKNTICLSFFTTENNLDFEKLQCLENDIYLKYWITKIFPIFDQNNFFNKFIACNKWVNKTLPNWYPKINITRRVVKLNRIEKILKKLLQLFSINNFYKYIQLNALSSDLKKLQNKDTRVIINDSMLKLYPLDRREKFYNEWQEKVLSLTQNS